MEQTNLGDSGSGVGHRLNDTSGRSEVSAHRHRARATMLSVADDFVDFFQYRNAVDDRTHLELLDTDMVVVPCWTADFCRLMIKAAEASGSFSANEHDPVPAQEVSLATISPVLFERIQNDFGSRIWPQLKSVWPLIDYHGINDAFIIKYEVGKQEELRVHHDVAQVSASIKLNDDYEGAVLEFPRQNKSNKSVPVGSMLAWPSLVTHPHASTPIRSGVKYSMTVWFELPLALG